MEEVGEPLLGLAFVIACWPCIVVFATRGFYASGFLITGVIV